MKVRMERDWGNFTANPPFLPVSQHRHVRGWWHRFLIFTERRRNGEDSQTTREKASSFHGS